jgi:hypothetical protein
VQFLDQSFDLPLTGQFTKVIFEQVAEPKSVSTPLPSSPPPVAAPPPTPAPEPPESGLSNRLRSFLSYLTRLFRRG